MYNLFTTSAEVKRQSYVNNKSTFALTGESYKGYFKPASLNDLIDKERVGKEFHYTTDYTADIQEGDILVIDKKKYNVKAVNKKRVLQHIEYTFCLLVND